MSPENGNRRAGDAAGHSVGRLGAAADYAQHLSSLAGPTDDALVDPRLIFLARAHARFIMVESGEIDLDEAFGDLIKSVCDCARWPLAAQWERSHPPEKYRRRWGRR
jgi:hypothetical protein